MESATPTRFFEDAFRALLLQLLASDIEPKNQRDIVLRFAQRTQRLADVMSNTIERGSMSADDAKEMTAICAGADPVAERARTDYNEAKQRVHAPQYGSTACR